MSDMDENQITAKLVKLLDNNKQLLKDFCKILPGFCGNINGDLSIENHTNKPLASKGELYEPDIVITDEDNLEYWIEVKTNYTTGYQENQISEDGYVKAIKQRNSKSTSKAFNKNKPNYTLLLPNDYKETTIENSSDKYSLTYKTLMNIIKNSGQEVLEVTKNDELVHYIPIIQWEKVLTLIEKKDNLLALRIRCSIFSTKYSE